MKKFLLTCIGLLGLMTAYADSWEKTDFSALNDGDEVVVVDLNSSRAISSAKATKKLPAVAVTLNEDKTEITSAVESSNVVFILEKVSGGVKFKSGENYLFNTTSNDGTGVGNPGANNCVYDFTTPSKEDGNDNGYSYLTDVKNTRYLGQYNNQDWRTYTTINSNIKNTNVAFYVKVISSEPTIVVSSEVAFGASKTAFEPKTLKVVGRNLSNAITFAWEKGTASPFSATGELTAEGGDLVISLVPTTTGEYSDNLVLTSGSVSKTVAVSAEILDASNSDVLTAANFVATGSNYLLTDNIEGTSGAVFAGVTAKNGNNIQLTTGNKDGQGYYGIVVTNSNKYIKKVTVDWANSSNGRILNVYVSNKPFDTSKAYASQGKLFGTMEKGKDTEISIDGQYKYVAIASNKNAIYLASVEYSWATPATETVTLAAGDYMSYSSNAAMNIPEGLTAYAVTAVNATEATITPIADVIPANTGVIFCNKGTEEAEFSLVPPVSGVAALEDNLLVATDGSEVEAGNYILAQPAGQPVGFYPLSAAYALPANKAYLPASAFTSGASFIKINFGVTGVESINTEVVNDGVMYNVMGQKVDSSYKGIVIMNGKKFINK